MFTKTLDIYKSITKLPKKQLETLYNNIDEYFEGCDKLGLELREGQYNMALSVYEAIESLEHLVIEAGVGIGKSYAYLIPLMYYYELTGKSFIISTSTIALQEQLEKDIEILSNQLNIPIDVVIAKGMSNFMCINRLEEYINANEKNKKILEKVSEDRQDRKDNPTIKDIEWNNINVKKCSYSKCQNCHNCEFYKRREQMKYTKGAIICNHDLLIEDLSRANSLGKALFQKVDFIVCDEAHNIESKVRSANTKIIKIDSIKETIKTALIVLERHKNYNYNYDKLMLITEELSKSINQSVQVAIEKLLQQNIEVDDCNGLEMIFNKEIAKLSSKLVEQLISINDSLYMISKKDVDEIQNALEEKIQMLRVLSKGNNSNYLFWIERKGKKNFINYAPKDIDKISYNLFFNEDNQKSLFGIKTFIFTSATLSTGKDDFSYFTKNIGADKVKNGLTIENSYESPYNYDKNALLYCCSDIASPKDKEKYLEQLVEKIKELIKITNGKTLVLFTSKTDMNYVYEKIGNKLGNINIYIQNDGSSQDIVKEKFKNNINSVLFSTGIFWEGIDIKGKALSNLIIARLPFPVVEPIMEYKKNLHKKNGFEKVYLPEMLIKLKQGVGRLIRSSTDKGIVCILDSRLKRQYEKVVKESIPIKNFTYDIEQVKQFVAKNKIND